MTSFARTFFAVIFGFSLLTGNGIASSSASQSVEFDQISLCPTSSKQVWQPFGQPYPCVPADTEIKFEIPAKQLTYSAKLNGQLIGEGLRASNAILVSELVTGLNTFEIYANSLGQSHLIKREFIIGVSDKVAEHSLNAKTQRMIIQLRPTENRASVISRYFNPQMVKQSFNLAMNGFVAEVNSAQLASLKRDAAVANIALDRIVNITTTQNSPTWGLDRIDQNELPLSNSYSYDYDGSGVDVYVIDSGIKTNHNEFTGRITRSQDFTNLGDVEDCDGHGTHVAGTVLGTTYGVAKNANVIPVRVFDCSGSAAFSTIIDGINWVIADHQLNTPAVVNMSLGGPSNTQLNTATQNLINDGIVTVVAAGNDASNACNYSPASAPQAITVGATTIVDKDPVWSNVGSCVDIFAPGENILSASIGASVSQTDILSGTSMAAPHVAGVAALLLDQHFSSITNKATTNQVIRDLIVDQATVGKLTSDYGSFTPGNNLASANRLLFSRSADAQLPPVAPRASGTITLTGNFTTGQEVVATGVTWSGYPDPEIEYRWLGCTRRDTAQRTNVAIPSDCIQLGTTATNEYEISPAGAGRYLRVQILGENATDDFSVLSATSRSLITGAPSNTVLPTITGTPTLNSTLRGTTGTWSANPRASTRYQWLQCTTNSDLNTCTSISRATSSSLRLTAAHGGFYIRVAVTARNSAGTAVATSVATSEVIIPPAAPSYRGNLVVRGTVRVGQELSATTLTWSGYPTPVITRSWSRCTTRNTRQTTTQPANCAVISGTNSTNYRVSAEDLGFFLVYSETAVNSSRTVTVWSAGTTRQVTN